AAPSSARVVVPRAVEPVTTPTAAVTPHRLAELDMAERVHNLEFGRSVRREPRSERRNQGQANPCRQDQRRPSPKLDPKRSGLSVRGRRPFQPRMIDGERGEGRDPHAHHCPKCPEQCPFEKELL